MTRRPRCAACAFAWPLLLAGCTRAADLAPPVLRLGEQECEACRMLISDERYAVALVVAHRGDTVKLAFDDLNCAILHLADSPPAVPHRLYVHDHETNAWIDARTAVFVRSDKLETPMAAQVAAASDQAGAERLLARYPGQILTFEQAAELFKRRSHATPQP
jgi:nitrous oxide reductase accessory protein NosL